MSWRDRFLAGDYTSIADSIKTDGFLSESARALIVFNSSSVAAGGIVSMVVDMSWRSGAALPPIRIVDTSTGRLVPSRTLNTVIAGARIRFVLQFASPLVPPVGYRTFTAEYSDEQAELIWPAGIQEIGCPVVETLRHDGPLPLILSFAGAVDVC